MSDEYYLLKKIPPENQHYMERIERHRKSIPVNVHAICQEMNITAETASLPFGTSGKIVKEYRGGYKIFTSAFDPHIRRRFTIAHEISHVLFKHFPENTNDIEENTLLRSQESNTKQEIDANYLAAYILMPLDKIDEIILDNRAKKTHLTVAALAAMFDVSEQAMAIRLGIESG